MSKWYELPDGMTPDEAVALIDRIEQRMIKRDGFNNVRFERGRVKYYRNHDDAISWRRQLAREKVVEIIRRRRRESQRSIGAGSFVTSG